jgi:integrase
MNRRTRVASGIYRDRYGLAGTVKVAGIQRERRFPADESYEYIKRWQLQVRAQLDADRPDDDADAPPRGTFAGDLPRYLKLIQHRASFKADRSHLRAWLPVLGPLPRRRIRPPQVAAALQQWQLKGLSPRTLRHRRRVLREFYKALDGPHARPPLAGITLPAPARPHPLPVPRATIQQVAKSLKAGKRHARGYGSDSDKTYARFLVRAMTGQRPSQIMRAQPGDVDLRRRIWFVRAGKGGHAIPLPLTPDMVRAWRVFVKAKAWGTFDTRSFSKTLRRHGWPADTRPYNLRHTFAIDHLLAGTPLGDLQGLLGHAQIETTRQHYAPVLLARLRKTVGRRKLKLA